MFPIKKLEELQPSQRRRKLILILTEIERTLRTQTKLHFLGAHDCCLASALSGNALGYGGGGRCGQNGAEGCGSTEEILASAFRFVADDPKILPEDRAAISSADEKLKTKTGVMSAEKTSLCLRLCNLMRNALMRAAGTFPAEWDLIHPESLNRIARTGTEGEGGATADGSPESGGECAAPARSFYSGVCVFAEDIRSPFNIGSILRTAEAFGAEKVFFSPGCAPAEHPRAMRSAMGCVEFMEWEKIPLERLPPELPLFALETGGTPIDEFEFPDRGIVIIGSEELGVSPEALELAGRRVSIPMKGIKASLNVGVAFGILMEAWTRSLRGRG